MSQWSQWLQRASRRLIAPTLLLLGFALGALFEAMLIHELVKREQVLARAHAAQATRQPGKAVCPPRPHWDPKHGRCDRLTISDGWVDRRLPARSI